MKRQWLDLLGRPVGGGLHGGDGAPTFADLGLRSWVPEAVERAVLACLEKDSINRPQSARELANRFNSALTQTDEVAPLKIAPSDAVPAPDGVVFHFDAWMPRRIAIVKLRGFVHDLGGEVVESEPGLIRVRLGARMRRAQSSSLSAWLGLGRREPPAPAAQEVELRLQNLDPRHENRLHVTVLFFPPTGTSPHDFLWRERCVKLFCDARAYLMGNTEN